MSSPINALIENRLNQFDTYNLSDNYAPELMDRVDTKFLISKNELPELLALLTGKCKLFKAGNHLINDYHNIYFDDMNMTFYHQHQRGKLNRFKVRIRTYGNQGDSFLEVKFKNNQQRTIKNRIPISDQQRIQNFICTDFLNNHMVPNAKDLMPTQNCNYSRITFANASTHERLTIDMDLRFFNHATESVIRLPELVIIELKQAKINRQSQLYQLINKIAFKQLACSKYCMGLVIDQHQPNFKHNLFKPALRIVRAISGVLINE